VPADALVLAYVAAFVPCKDHATLIAAMGILQERGINAHVLLIGKGMLMEQSQTYTATQPHASRVHFLGARNDVRRWMGMIDIYVHPGRGEGFGLAVVEAMLARRPVIGAASGAIVEYVQPEVNGELFEAGNATDLAEKVMKLSADPESARRLGETARKYCLEHFSIDHFADRVCDFLELAQEV